MAKRKYVLVRQSMQSFIERQPIERLVWLAKICLDEIAPGTAAEPQAKLAVPEPRELRQNGRTL